MNYNQILKEGENFLKKSNIKNPNLDTELILSKVINKKRVEILLNTNNKLNKTDLIKLTTICYLFLILNKYISLVFTKFNSKFSFSHKCEKSIGLVGSSERNW